MIKSKNVNQDRVKKYGERLKKVEPATMGHYLDYGFMDPCIQSRLENVSVFGSAFTVKTNINDSTMVHKAVSMAGEGDVIIIDRTGDQKHAPVGEMIVYAAKQRGVAGIIIDGPCTDIQAIREIGLPVYSTGLSPITTKLLGLGGEINTPIQCGGVVIKPGDLILGDDNGVLVIDEKVDLEDILAKAEEDESEEQIMKEKIDAGTVLSELTEADELIEEMNKGK